MDIIVCIYPLYLTYQEYIQPADSGQPTIPTQSDLDNLSFLTVWWSTFGTFSLLEQYAGLSSLPFYSFSKAGILLTMYSTNYRKWVTEKTLEGVSFMTKKGQDIGISVIKEHWPNVTKYIKLDGEKDKDEQKNGWFSWLW